MLWDPLLIYIKGKDAKEKDASYVCTFLEALEFMKATTNLTNDRILFYFSGTPQKCKKKKYKSLYEGKNVPGDVHVIRNDVMKELLYGIEKKCIPGVTPIFFIFDGHGYVSDKDLSIGYTKDRSVVGNMILDTMDMGEGALSELFVGLEKNPKLLMFTQCGSKNLMKRCRLPNSVIVSSTDKDNACSYGVDILHKVKHLVTDMLEHKNADLDFFTETLLCNGLGIKKQPGTIDWPMSVFFTRFDNDSRFADNDLNRVLGHPLIKKHFKRSTILRSINKETKTCLVRLLFDPR